MGISASSVDNTRSGHKGNDTALQDAATWEQAVGELKDAVNADVCAIGVPPPPPRLPVREPALCNPRGTTRRVFGRLS